MCVFWRWSRGESITCRYFLPSCRCLFLLLVVSFAVQKLVSSMRSPDGRAFRSRLCSQSALSEARSVHDTWGCPGPLGSAPTAPPALALISPSSQSHAWAAKRGKHLLRSLVLLSFPFTTEGVLKLGVPVFWLCQGHGFHVFFFVCLFLFCFLGPHRWHVEVPGLGV